MRLSTGHLNRIGPIGLKTSIRRDLVPSRDSAFRWTATKRRELRASCNSVLAFRRPTARPRARVECALYGTQESCAPAARPTRVCRMNSTIAFGNQENRASSRFNAPPLRPFVGLAPAR